VSIFAKKRKKRNSPERGNLRDAFGVRLVGGAHARLVSGGTRVTGFPFPTGSFASSTHLVCFLVREQRELLERAGQRGAPASRALLVRNVHGGARHDV